MGSNEGVPITELRQVLAHGAHPDQRTVLFPHIETQRVRLRPALAADGPATYELFLRTGMNNLPNMDVFVAGYSRELSSHSAYSRDLAAQFAIQQRRDGEEVGFGGLFELSPAGHVELGLYTDLRKADVGIGAEATLLFINYAFATWQIRKVYMRTTDASRWFFGGTLASMVRKEACLPDHMYFRGRLWDMDIYAIYRSEWDARGAALVERLVTGPRTGGDGHARP